MAVVGIARLAGKLLGPKVLRTLGGNQGVRQIANEALMSGAANTGLNMLGGMDPLSAATYGLVDTAVSAGSIGLVRGLRKPKGYRIITEKGPDGKEVTTRELKRSKLEVPTNWIASGASAFGLMGMGVGMNPQGINNAQPTQVVQQQQQRAAVNQDPSLLAGAYLPYTNFQNLGMPSRSALLEQAMNDSGPGFDMAGYEKGMQQILGL